MKKGVFHVLLALLLLIPFVGTNFTAQAAGFSDVPSRASKEVNYLAEGGIANGSSTTIFASDKIVTRAEAAVFIGRALQLNGKQRETSFKDVGSGNFASGYIQSAVEKGILSGYDGGRFQPDGQVTRGEMAVMLSKAFGYSFGGTLSGATKALMSQGIARGLEDGTFGSDNLITRVDFSVFLARAINPEFRTKISISFSKKLWTNTGDLNIRSGPNTSFASKGTLNANVQVAGAHTVGGWTYVKAGTKTGFVSTYYLRSTETSSQNNPVVEDADSRLSGQTIVIDPGHGGSDPGASGFGDSEKTVTLAVGLKVNSLFKNTPFKVAMTRTSDTYPTLTQRTSFAKNQGGDVFVSIHNNSASEAANGTETYYYSAANNPYVADSKLLASKIQARMLTAWDLNDRKVKVGNFAVLRENTMPAALAELGFITNKGDNAKLTSDYWQTAAAKAIYLGILDYYKAKGYNTESLYSVAK
ncbi:N-acetylmuramoyl-L-alanine amidase [Domibacillus robiginosus]|uniref:N-acetylmuramoyl-L-alanine amidase n=1 Tax=Domibacillus robiginosus TaxID=1071054 RepID=UPI00067CC669|nr:N-acetylmuramoyl-L-alanine amidase [Domibacillus robiginosus]